MRHIIGIFGVLAAFVLLVVSAAMNWRFGYSLGKTELDGIIYGSASAAADCLKALVPFFFFAALRNKIWSQAIAAAIVGLVCVVYSLTSALGHAALNRFDTTGQRAAAAQKYQDLRLELQHAYDRLSWIPQHRPLGVIESEIKTLKNDKPWSWTNGCQEVNGKIGREFCKSYNNLLGELSAANQSEVLNTQVQELSAKISKENNPSAVSEADPQATVIAKLTGYPVNTIQTALTVFIALLLEVGSCFGMYVAVSQWKLYGQEPLVTQVIPQIDQSYSPKIESEEKSAYQETSSQASQTSTQASPQAIQTEPLVNKVTSAEALLKENEMAPVIHRLIAPVTDVARFYNECLQAHDGNIMNATEIYEIYCGWCRKKDKPPVSLPTFGRQFSGLGIEKTKQGGRNIYLNIRPQSYITTAKNKNIANFPTKVA